MLLQATHFPACGVRSWLPASSATGWVKCGSHSGLGLCQPVTGGCGPSAHRLTLLGSVAPKALPGVHVLYQPTHWTGASALPEAARQLCRPLKGLVARQGPHLILYRCCLLVLWNSGPHPGENDPGPWCGNTACAREGGF